MLFDRHLRGVTLGDNTLDRGINTALDETRIVSVRLALWLWCNRPFVLCWIRCCGTAICGFEFLDGNFFIVLLISRIDRSNSDQESFSVLYLLWRCLSVRGH